MYLRIITQRRAQHLGMQPRAYGGVVACDISVSADLCRVLERHDWRLGERIANGELHVAVLTQAEGQRIPEHAVCGVLGVLLGAYPHLDDDEIESQ